MHRTDSTPDLALFGEMFSVPPASQLVCMAFLFVLSLIAVPTAGDQSLALIFAAAATTALYVLSQSLSYVLSLLLPAAVLYLLTGGLALPAFFTALLLGGSCGAVLLLSLRGVRQMLLFCAAPVLAYGAAFLLCRDPLLALLALLPVPLALAGFALARCCTRQTEAVATLSGILAAALALVGLLSLLRAGLLNGNPVTIFAEALRSALTRASLEALAEIRTVYAEAGLTLPITDEAVTSAISAMVNLLPGIFLVATTLTAFFIWRAELNFIQNLKILPRIPTRMGALDFSPVTAIVFILAFFTDLVGNATHMTFAGTVGINLALVLTPGLALVGYAALSPHRGERRSCLSALLFFGLILATVANLLTGVLLAALLGAVNVLLVTFMPRSQHPHDNP